MIGTVNITSRQIKARVTSIAGPKVIASTGPGRKVKAIMSGKGTKTVTIISRENHSRFSGPVKTQTVLTINGSNRVKTALVGTQGPQGSTGPRGPIGLPGRDGIDGIDGDKNYVHMQIGAATQWNVAHNLNKLPAISVIDTANEAVEGIIEYVDINNATVSFSAPFSGKAVCN